MFRILNIVAVLVLVGSAVYAYEIKYATLFQAEQLAKAKRDLARETDRVTMLKAEWAQLASPARIETLAEKHLGGQTLQLTQVVLASAVPDKAARGDEIAAKLSDLGLGAPSKTPSGEGGHAVAAKPKESASAKPKEPAGKPKEPAKPKEPGKPAQSAKAER